MTDDLERAARELATTTPMSLTEARASLVQHLSADEKAVVARFGIHDDEPGAGRGATIDRIFIDEAVPAAAEMSIEAFLIDQNITRAALGEMLREYRSETGYTPFEYGDRDVLASDFLNWHRWERLA